MTIQELRQMTEEGRARIEAAEAELIIRAEIAAEDAARDMVLPIRGGHPCSVVRGGRRGVCAAETGEW